MIFPQYRGALSVIFYGCLLLLVSNTSAAVAGSLPSWMRFGVAHNGCMRQWTNCTPTEEVPRDVSIGVAMTSKLFSRFGNNKAEANKWIGSVVDGTNFIYMNQLNVRLVVNSVFFAPSTGIPWNNPSCSMGLDAQLNKLSEWKPPSEQGLWHLLDDCLEGSSEGESGIFSEVKSGLANKGTLCRMGPGDGGKYANVGISNYFKIPVLGDLTYRVFAHEVGHTFGGSHPYGEDVVLFDGGIMSYGTGHYHCDLGFSPLNKEEICSVLTSAEETQCAALSVPTTSEGNMSRAQFMATVPEEPLSFDSDVYTCGWEGFSFSELVVTAVLALCLCCSFICCCFCALRRVCCGSDYDEDEDEDSEIEGSE